MGSLKVWDSVAAAWATVGNLLRVRDIANANSEYPASELQFPDGTVHPQGSGVVKVYDVPTGVIGCKVYNSTTQSVADSTETTVTFDSEVFDTDGFHSTSSNTGRMTIPVGLSGKYLVIAYLAFQDNSTGFRGALLYKNGSANAERAVRTQPVGVSGWDTTVVLTEILDLAANDYIEVKAYQDNTTNVALTIGHASAARIQSMFAIYKLGSGNVAGLDAARAQRTSGNITANSTTFANLDTGLDISVPAQAGDVLLVGAEGQWGSEALVGYLDACTLVSGSPVNYISGGSGGASDGGVPGWMGSSGVNMGFGASIQYVVQSGDISSSTVTLRLRYRTASASNKTFGASSAAPFKWSVVNLRGGAASRDIGYEFGYTEFTSNVNVTGTTEAASNVVVSAPAIAFDGNTRVIIEFYSPVAAADPNADGRDLYLVLYDGTNYLGRIATRRGRGSGASATYNELMARRRLTPAAGTITYSVRALVTAGTGVVGGGPGGSGQNMPGYIRIMKA